MSCWWLLLTVPCVQALFRTLDPWQGRILVDGVDCRTVRPAVLRRGLAIIPQDPVLFTGTLRSNLDPFGQHTDAEVWAALERCTLADYARRHEEGLACNVDEGGKNFSVGQRQLLCLGRAVLSSALILCVDEATANVDHETDALIQATIREVFAGRTVITIAHRVSTVLQCDRVIVMDAGEVAEDGSPDALVDAGGLFAELVVASRTTPPAPAL